MVKSRWRKDGVIIDVRMCCIDEIQATRFAQQ